MRVLEQRLHPGSRQTFFLNAITNETSNFLVRASHGSPHKLQGFRIDGIYRAATQSGSRITLSGQIDLWGTLARVHAAIDDDARRH